MRIAIVSERVEPRRGGAETYVADLLRALDQRGHETLLFAAAWDPRAIPERTSPIHVPYRGSIRLSQIWNFAHDVEKALRSHSHRFDVSLGLINTWSHDVIIPQGGVRPASLAANARRFPPGIPRAFYALLKIASPRHLLYRLIEERQYHPDRQASVIAPSFMVQNHIQKYHHVPSDRLYVIHNAIDVNRLIIPDPATARGGIRSRFGISDQDFVALFVGHNFRLKGLPQLLEAMALRLRNQPAASPVHLLVCGSGKSAPMRKLARRLGIDRHLHIAGYLDDIRDAYHASDAFVLPTYYDPCSLVLFEALACGLPVITTACNGAGEVITQGREGFVIPHPSDIPALARALDHITIPEKRSAMASAALALGQRQSFDRHVDQLTSLLARIVDSRTAPRRESHSPQARFSTPRSNTLAVPSGSRTDPRFEEA
jgi:UDP-glucose:(heptosyl)LPS alpha-1,3-glucosyltransferase